MQLSILGWLASRCARDANQRGMAECEKREKTWSSPREDRRMVMESADWLNHGTEELLQQRRLLHADSDNHETVAKGNPEVKRINGSTNNTKYCLLVQ